MHRVDRKTFFSWTIPIILIWVVTFMTGGIDIRLPGLYFDAVYPDYLGAVGAFRGADNFTQITRHVGLPLLGNFYHGTISAGIQYIVLKCVGHASQMTLRYTNLACFAILGSLVYFIGRRAGRSKLIPLAGVLLCVSAPNVLTIPRTQYYIMLHGCIFFFLSVIVLLVKTDGETEVPPNILVLAGVLQGLAFYGYFTYLFLAPATLIVALLSCRGTLLQKIQGGGYPVPLGYSDRQFGIFYRVL